MTFTDLTVPCPLRTLTVRLQVEREGEKRAASRKEVSKTRNCGSMFPIRGFTAPAEALGFACEDGRWREGSYRFSVSASLDDPNELHVRSNFNWKSPGC